MSDIVTKVFLEIGVDGKSIGIINLGLYDEIVPRTTKNFI